MRGGAKRNVYCALERPQESCGAPRVFGVMLLALIAANAVSLVMSTDAALSADVRHVLALFEFASACVFAAEYAARVWTADLARPQAKSPACARLRYVCSAWGVIDVLAFAPVLVAPFVPLSLNALAALRVVRLMRLLKITRYMRGLRVISRVAHDRRSEIVAAAMVVALLAVASSVLMYYLENPAQPDVFDSAWTGLYWAMTTITSTGYGDVVPITVAGRVLGFCTMALSIAVVAIPGGIFSAGFVEEYRRQLEEKGIDEQGE